MTQPFSLNKFLKQYRDFYLFFARIIVVFLILFTMMTVVKKNPVLDRTFKTSTIVYHLSKATAYSTKGVLNVLGYEANVEYTYAYSCIIDQGVFSITIPGSRGIWLGGHCLGLKLLALFVVLIACFPGRIKPKILYIVGGLIFLEIIYIARLVYLSILSKDISEIAFQVKEKSYYVSAWVENKVVGRMHDDLNTGIYFLVVIMFIIYIQYFSKGRTRVEKPQ